MDSIRQPPPMVSGLLIALVVVSASGCSVALQDRVTSAAAMLKHAAELAGECDDPEFVAAANQAAAQARDSFEALRTCYNDLGHAQSDLAYARSMRETQAANVQSKLDEIEGLESTRREAQTRLDEVRSIWWYVGQLPGPGRIAARQTEGYSQDAPGLAAEIAVMTHQVGEGDDAQTVQSATPAELQAASEAVARAQAEVPLANAAYERARAAGHDGDWDESAYHCGTAVAAKSRAEIATIDLKLIKARIELRQEMAKLREREAEESAAAEALEEVSETATAALQVAYARHRAAVQAAEDCGVPVTGPPPFPVRPDYDNTFWDFQSD